MTRPAPRWIMAAAAAALALPLAARAHADEAPHFHLSETFSLPYAQAVPAALLCATLGLWLCTRRQAWPKLAGAGALAAGAALLIGAR